MATVNVTEYQYPRGWTDPSRADELSQTLLRADRGWRHHRIRIDAV